ncbi:MAG: hypothetical protein PUH00_04155 [Clostridiales bacterium]|uniref:hypothetical protein n=1 Tax=Evtepia sp. TaxID=2773933 RepID=UPI002983997B|nr:hypothetical protein [Evtepia sp.]MDD7288895.1 hypothetical protein [Clostridiales bacterium]MDY4429487.1 hypothetical protein [Evtepia sp.]
MAIPSRKNRKTSDSPTPRYTIRGTNNRGVTIPMFREKDIPPGRYAARVSEVELVKTRAGDDAVSVTYELKASNGKTLKAREIIPLDSWAFSLWSDAMIAAGLNTDSDIMDAVGIEEEFEVFYPSPNGLGQLKNRLPATKARATVTSEEEETYEEEDDDDDDDDDDFEELDLD